MAREIIAVGGKSGALADPAGTQSCRRPPPLRAQAPKGCLGRITPPPHCRDAPWGVSGAAVSVPGVGPLGRLRRVLSSTTAHGASLQRGRSHGPPPDGADAKPGAGTPLGP